MIFKCRIWSVDIIKSRTAAAWGKNDWNKRWEIEGGETGRCLYGFGMLNYQKTSSDIFFCSISQSTNFLNLFSEHLFRACKLLSQKFVNGKWPLASGLTKARKWLMLKIWQTPKNQGVLRVF